MTLADLHAELAGHSFCFREYLGLPTTKWGERRENKANIKITLEKKMFPFKKKKNFPLAFSLQTTMENLQRKPRKALVLDLRKDK